MKSSIGQDHVIYQPNVLQEGCYEGDGAVGRWAGEGFERPGVGYRHIIHPESAGFEDMQGGVDEDGNGLGGVAGLYGGEGPVDSGGICALVGCQPDVAAGHGKAVGFPDDGTTVEGGGKPHYLQQPLDDHTLLVILAAHKEMVGF